jgi:hypothetical protein
MRRRYFLRTMAAISAVAASLPVMMPVQDPLDAGLGDSEAMCALGRRYLDLHPEETAAVSCWRAALVSAGQTGMHGHAARQARLDLESGTVVVVDGWVLPRSLALTCSALALA